MSETATTTESAPVQLTLEQELEQTLGMKEGAAPSPEAAIETPPAETPAAETPDELTAKLEAIEEPKAEAEAAKPALTPEQERILALVPNPQVAETVTQLANGYNNFTQAFAAGEFENVERMLETWNPDAYNAFLEHVYQQKVASGDWVDRWIADKEGNPTVHRGLTSLQQQIAELKSEMAKRDQQQQTYAQQAAQQRVYQQYNDHVTKLFDQIDFAPEDRKIVYKLLNADVSTNPRIRAAIEAGNVAAVNGLFKSVVSEYVGRDKLQSVKREQTIAIQDKKKPLVSGGTVVQDNALPDDVNQVPKERLKEWEEQQLAKLFSRKK